MISNLANEHCIFLVFKQRFSDSIELYVHIRRIKLGTGSRDIGPWSSDLFFVFCYFESYWKIKKSIFTILFVYSLFIPTNLF